MCSCAMAMPPPPSGRYVAIDWACTLTLWGKGDAEGAPAWRQEKCVNNLNRFRIQAVVSELKRPSPSGEKTAK
jgi:hypothetical protein